EAARWAKVRRFADEFGVHMKALARDALHHSLVSGMGVRVILNDKAAAKTMMGEMFPVNFVPDKIREPAQLFGGLVNRKKLRMQLIKCKSKSTMVFFIARNLPRSSQGFGFRPEKSPPSVKAGLTAVDHVGLFARGKGCIIGVVSSLNR